jgi:hypothetical protein
MRLFAIALAAAAASFAAGPQPYFGEPSISPDRSEIAFVSGGDIWTVPARGGDAHLLVSHPATESRPLYSPDGRFLAFTSNRTGNGDVYLLTFATGELKRLTSDDSNELVEGWSPDSRWIYFSSPARDIGTSDIYRVNRDGGTPMIVSGDRYVPEYFARISKTAGCCGPRFRAMDARSCSNVTFAFGDSIRKAEELLLSRSFGEALPPARQSNIFLWGDSSKRCKSLRMARKSPL